MPNLRIVQPNERPTEPVRDDWQPVLPATMPAAVVAPVPAGGPARATPGAARTTAQDTAGAHADVSVDEVLAHMEETLRLIREMRRETSSTNSWRA